MEFISELPVDYEDPSFNDMRSVEGKQFSSCGRWNNRFKQIDVKDQEVQVYCISDLHADAGQNLQWVRDKCLSRASNEATTSIIIIAGDVGSKISSIESTFEILTDNFGIVCYIPGNHEMWLMENEDMGLHATENSNRTSEDKLNCILTIAEKHGVYTYPIRIVGDHIQSILIVPLYSWYHQSWDIEPEISHPRRDMVSQRFPFSKRWGDYSMCSWPSNIVPTQEDFVNPQSLAMDTALAEAFANWNEPCLFPRNHVLNKENKQEAGSKTGSPLASPTDLVISFSHFVPRIELMPEKRFLLEPYLMKVIGSDLLEAQIRRLQPHIHIFGHTHIPIDSLIQGIEYVQWPLGYQREAAQQCASIQELGPLLLVDSSSTSYLPSAQDHVSTEVSFSNPSPSTPKMPRGSLSRQEDRLSYACHWSAYYRANDRNPGNCTELAPWVEEYLKKYN